MGQVGSVVLEICYIWESLWKAGQEVWTLPSWHSSGNEQGRYGKNGRIQKIIPKLKDSRQARPWRKLDWYNCALYKSPIGLENNLRCPPSPFVIQLK